MSGTRLIKATNQESKISQGVYLASNPLFEVPIQPEKEAHEA